MRFLIALFAAAASFAQQANPHRQALVIGNSAYSALPALPGALRDARLIATTLEDAGFTVKRIEDLHNDDLFRVENQFVAGIQPGDICFVYYSGYSAEIVDDDDYLLPVDFKPAVKTEMEQRAFRLSRILQDLDARQPSLKIAMIEAPHEIRSRIEGGPGEDVASALFMPDVTKTPVTLIALAAHHRQYVAADGLFTRTVADRINQHGLTLEEVFEQAKQLVGTQTAQRQLPDWTSNVIPKFYFHDPDPIPVTVDPPKIVVERVSVPVIPQNPKDRQEYVLIPAGDFKMGCVAADKRCRPEEKPQHEVTIPHDFWLGRNEVTVIAYRRFVESLKGQLKMPSAGPLNPGWKQNNYPMIMVRWEDANAFCGWAGGRLPTEAEWEYAARAGKDDEVYPLNSENSRDKANFYGKKGSDIFEQLAEVRQFDENAFRLFDMAGNVWEWVSDWWSPTYYAESAKVDPKGPKTGRQHVERGGSFESSWEEHLRLSFRQPEGGPNFKTGFRCALDDSAETKKLLRLQ